MIEENFFIPIIRRNLVSPRENWREAVAGDLDHPKFKITFLEAVAIRLRYNYVWIFMVILFAWLAKIHLHPTAALSAQEAFARLPVGPFSHVAILGGVALFYGTAVFLAIWARTVRGGADEVQGVEKSMERWKT